ncbi:hypothetical protein AAY473_021095, partial [Plecturocebus cupreus]
MGPAEPVHPVYSAPGSAALGHRQNSHASEKSRTVEAGFLHVGQTVLKLLTSGDPPTFHSKVLELQTGFHHVGQASLELPTSGDPPALASKGLTPVTQAGVQ